MEVSSLDVSRFRNLGDFWLEAGPGPNIIYGDNAQGKTNLLEAIWLFSGSRSFRGSRDRDFLQKEGEEIAALSLGFKAEGREQEAVLRFGNGGERRHVELNGVKKDSPMAFSGIFCAVLFSPDHMSLVKGGPEGRRQMIDTSLSQAYPKYTRAMDNYQKALKQRNTLLKDISHHPSLLDMLELWDRHIMEYGGYISALRAGYIRQLGEHAAEVYRGISSGKEEFGLTYQPSFGEQFEGFTLSDFQNAVGKALAGSREEDIRFGSTSVGPHRDDLLIEVAGLSARSFGSQGQQRSAILALKLAECEILEERYGEPPVVMLDDVMSELDASRRSYLLNQMENKQVFITCCDTSAFQGMEGGRVFHMKSGMLYND